jgi:hypothetical protein
VEWWPKVGAVLWWAEGWPKVGAVLPENENQYFYNIPPKAWNETNRIMIDIDLTLE